MMASFKIGKRNGVGKMIQWSYRRPCLVPSIHVDISPTTCNCSFRVHSILFWPPQTPTLTCMYLPYKHMTKNNKINLQKNEQCVIIWGKRLKDTYETPRKCDA